MKIAAIILAAGKGTRMTPLRQGSAGQASGEASPIPKVMFQMNGKPVIDQSVKLIEDAGVDDVFLVVGYKKELIKNYFGEKVKYINQEEQLGTGHAVMMGKDQLAGKYDTVIVFYGDNPLFKPDTVKKIIDLYNNEKPAIALLSVNFEDPSYWEFGRIVRNQDGDVIASVEQKDCTEDQLKIKECNTCFYVFDANWLWQNIENLKNDNAQKEYYLTDMVKIAVEQNKKVIAMPVSEESEALGINTQEQLKQAEEILESRISN